MLARSRTLARHNVCTRHGSPRFRSPVPLQLLNVRQSSHDANGQDHSISGRRIAIKDNIVTSELPTTASSSLLDGHNSPFDATVVKLLRSHGADISFKTDLDEFGMGSHNQHSTKGSLPSPFKREGKPLSPGGSSGGSAVAVATKECWAALGTDTGGSVRLPAAYTGIVGFKPSYGLLSRWGVIPYANSLDTVGILAPSVQVTRTVFRILNAYDERDPSSLKPAVRERIRNDSVSSDRRLRIGVPAEYNTAEVSDSVRLAWKRSLHWLRAQGHELVNITLPTTETALSTYYILAPAEASSNLAKYDGIRYGRRFQSTGPASSGDKLPLYAATRGTGFGQEVKRRILLGAYTLSSAAIDNYFIQAQKVRRMVQNDFNTVFAKRHPLLDPESTETRTDEGVDVLLTPAAPTLPPTIEEVNAQSSIETYMNDVFTVPASLAGLPAVSVPIAVSGQQAGDVQSAGMQIIGQFGDDERVLDAAARLMDIDKQ